MTPTVTTGADRLDLCWPDGTVGSYPYLWLRDADPAGFHPQTQERQFDLSSIAPDVAPLSAEVADNALVLTWPDTALPSAFDLDWIKAFRPGQRRADPAEVTPLDWRAELGAGGVPRHRAGAIADSDAAMLDWLRETKRFGLSIVEGLDDDFDAGVDFARRIGFLRETNFGVIFEVFSKPDPNNLAYTAEALPLHTDLPNQELSPGYQFLHCYANESRGGGSTFCNGIAVAADLRDRFPDDYALLSSVSVPFRFHDETADLRMRKTVIVLDEEGALSEINFNAHLADIVDLEPPVSAAFYRAYHRFMTLLRDPAYTVSLRLRAGEMVVFDNRRVLHGREAFDPTTGARHLRGCYVDRGEWDSRMRVLARSNR